MAGFEAEVPIGNEVLRETDTGGGESLAITLQPVLRDLNLAVQPGQTVAIMGASGIGKSTLLSLVVRLHEPDAGRILLDGRELRDYTVESLRRRCGIVLQENLLFAGTIHDNIALGLPAAAGH